MKALCEICRMTNTIHRRLAHIASFEKEPLVFFTVVVHRRMNLLDNPQAHTILHELWERSAKMNAWWVGDYLLMPDHVHLFARASRTADTMRSWVKMWKSVSSRGIMKHHKLSGPLWQKDYFDRYLRNSENYSEKWAYVEANPVRAGLVKHAYEWPYRGRIHSLTF